MVLSSQAEVVVWDLARAKALCDQGKQRAVEIGLLSLVHHVGKVRCTNEQSILLYLLPPTLHERFHGCYDHHLSLHHPSALPFLSLILLGTSGGLHM